jgi:hypothetical protein
MKTENTDLCELDDLVIPRCLLEAAEITGNCDLEIQCVPGAIIITTDDTLECVPPPLMALFHDLGISDAAVRNVLMEGGIQNE